MKLLYYFMTARKDVLAAWAKDLEASKAIDAEAQAFADLFGGVPLFTRGFAPAFAGIGFTQEKPCPNPRLWGSNEEGVYHPIHPKNVPATMAQEAFFLHQKWKQYPVHLTRPRLSELMHLLGIQVRDMQDNALYFVELHDIAYFASTIKLKDMTEVVATVFEAADREADLPQPGEKTYG